MNMNMNIKLMLALQRQKLESHVYLTRWCQVYQVYQVYHDVTQLTGAICHGDFDVFGSKLTQIKLSNSSTHEMLIEHQDKNIK